MTYTLWLFLIGVACIVLAAYLVLRMFLDQRQRLVITVARPTTTDGEQVQITANLKASLGAGAIAEHIEKCSLAITGRVVSQNELLLKTQVQGARAVWTRIKQKKDAGVKLSHAELKFWDKVGEMFDEHGLKDTVTEAQLLKAAEAAEK